MTYQYLLCQLMSNIILMGHPVNQSKGRQTPILLLIRNRQTLAQLIHESKSETLIVMSIHKFIQVCSRICRKMVQYDEKNTANFMKTVFYVSVSFYPTSAYCVEQETLSRATGDGQYVFTLEVLFDFFAIISTFRWLYHLAVFRCLLG